MAKVFISYSHKDEGWKERLHTQLAVLEQQGLLSVWEDRQIAAGDDWYPEIESALKEAAVAILLISANFLTSRFILGEEIPRLLERRRRDGLRVIPLILKPCPWQKVPWLTAIQGRPKDNRPLSGFTEHDQEQCLADLALEIDRLLGPVPAKPGATATHRDITLDRLPTTRGDFFGREDELRLLDEAWNSGGGIRVVQFIAAGGVGKTKLLRHWIDRTAGIEALVAWSFYSQGSSEDKQVSASPFFEALFKVLEPGTEQRNFATEEERGEHLAGLLRRRRCLLVLDGLEPLQHADKANRGELKDRAVRALLRGLAGDNPGLCVVTSRVAVDELRDRAHVESRDLVNLAPADGARLLRSLKVRGNDAELEQAARDYGGHALALSLLGNALATFEGGDLRRRDALEPLLDDDGQASRHARKVMQAYVGWLAGTAELRLLSLLGLFEQPIGAEVLDVLCNEAIPGLTDGMTDREWKRALHALREDHHLLYAADGQAEVLDCHPLIREYFGARLRAEQPGAWRQAHERLYEYYKALPKQERPDTLDEMRPLFSAIAHGCAAGLHQKALDEVYWPRVSRERYFFSTNKLGAFGDDLAAVAHFFEVPWHRPAAGLTDVYKAGVLNWAGFRLLALGRLREAVEPMRIGAAMQAKEENWKNAALGSSNLSELQLTLGDLVEAIGSARLSVRHADESEDSFQRMVNRTTLADALHQAAETAEALALFEAAERMQQERQPQYPRLYSLQGFLYCDLLLARGEAAAVLERFKLFVEWRSPSDSLLDQALENLAAGLAHAQLALGSPLCKRGARGDLSPEPERNPPQSPFCQGGSEDEHWQAARDGLDQAVASLRAAGQQQILPRGLLARAAYARWDGDYPAARRDLAEAFDIAERGEMRLHLTDYYLEAARLALAEAANPHPALSHGERVLEAARHTDAAAQLIAATGYRRRLPELEELRAALAGSAPSPTR
jgi:tetratricopeptide (TPR) repeat protein